MLFAGDVLVHAPVARAARRADGTYRDIALNERATGPGPDELRRVPRRVCAVAGDNKVAPLRAALRAGVVTDLVVDEITASRLVGGG